MTRSEIVGENILRYRTALGMSQIDFADLIGRSQTMVSMYERGQRLPSTQILAQIAKVLGVPFSSLYFSQEERHEQESESFVDDDYFPPSNYFTSEECRLVRAYRNAPTIIRKAALEMLESNAIEKERHA